MRKPFAVFLWVAACASAFATSRQVISPDLEGLKAKCTGAITDCRSDVATVALPGVGVAVNPLDTLPEADKKVAAKVLALLQDTAAGAALDKREQDVADRLTQFLWSDYKQATQIKVPAAPGSAEEKVVNIEISDFISDAAARENVVRDQGVLNGDRTAGIKAWVHYKPAESTLLYYVLGPGTGSPPAWIDAELAQKLKEASGKYAEPLFASLRRWTKPAAEKTTLPVRPAGLLPDAAIGRRAIPIDAPWLHAFLTDAAAQVTNVVNGKVNAAATESRIQRTRQLVSVPAGTPLETNTLAPNARPGRDWTANELLGQSGDPDVVFLYEGHSLSVRLISVRNPNSENGSHKDWISIVDRTTKEAKIIPVDAVGPTAFSFMSSDGKTAYNYVVTLVDHTSRDGISRKWVQIKSPDGKAAMNVAGGEAQLYVGPCPQWEPSCKGSLDDLRRQRAAALGVVFKIPIVERGGQEKEFFLVPVFSVKGCYEFIEKNPNGTAGKVAGVACTHQVKDGIREAINGANVELGQLMGDGGNYYCFKPKPEGGWMAYTGGACKVGKDKPVEPAKPGTVTAANKDNPAATNPTEQKGDPKQATADNAKYLELLKNAHAEIGTDSTGNWAIAYFTQDAGGNKRNYFYLLYPDNKAVSFQGALVCESASACIKEDGDDLVVRTAAVDPKKWDGESIQWLSLADKDPKDPSALKSSASGKYYPVSEVKVLRLPKAALQELVTNPRQPMPSARVASLETKEQPPSVTGDRSTGEFNFHVRWDDWEQKLQRFFDVYGKDSPIFGPTQADNRQMVVAYIKGERESEAAGAKEEWDPFVTIKMFQVQALRGRDAVVVAEYIGRGADGDGVHKCKLKWTYDGGPRGKLVKDCK